MSSKREELDNPEETLAYIKNFLTVTQKAFFIDSFYYLYWGTVIPLWTGLTYMLQSLGLLSHIKTAWLSLYAGSALLIFVREKRRRKSVRTFAGRIYGTLWSGVFLTAAALLLSIYETGLMNVTLGLSLAAGLLGMAYWVGGYLLEKKSVSALALCWWLAGISFSRIPGFWVPAAMAAATVLLELIPGILIFRTARGKAGA